MPSVGSNVEAALYNDYVQRVNLILGIGAGRKGYGVAMSNTGTAVVGTTDISADQWAGLRTDLNLIHQHQLNTTTAIGEIVSGNIIGADESNVGTGSTVLRDNATDTFTIVNPDSNKGVNDFGPTFTAIEADPEQVFASHLVLESKITPSTSGASYTATWNGTLTAIIYFKLDNVIYQVSNATVNQATVDAGIEEIATTTWAGFGTTLKELTGSARDVAVSVFGGILNNGSTVTANGDDHRRHFFNTGGDIRFSTAGANGSGSKSADWNTMLTNFGTITFKNSSTTTTGTATVGSGFGSEDLTTSYQQVAVKFGSASNYAENSIKVEAKHNNSGTISFRFTWADTDTGDPFTDENVDLDINLSMSQTRCNGPISIATPTYSVAQSIS